VSLFLDGLDVLLLFFGMKGSMDLQIISWAGYAWRGNVKITYSFEEQKYMHQGFNLYSYKRQNVFIYISKRTAKEYANWTVVAKTPFGREVVSAVCTSSPNAIQHVIAKKQ